MNDASLIVLLGGVPQLLIWVAQKFCVLFELSLQ